MRRQARREGNRESLELWLVTRGVKLSTRPPSHPDEHHGRTGKPGSRVNQDDTWVEAISQPDAINTNRFFERALARLEDHLPAIYAILQKVYFGPSSDPSLPETWRRQNTVSGQWGAIAVEVGIDHILDQADAENRLLYWPSPDEAKGYVERNQKKKREAIHVYHRERDRGVQPTAAVRRAAVEAKCSESAVWRWVGMMLSEVTRKHAERERMERPA